jgi:hypothetical protein
MVWAIFFPVTLICACAYLAVGVCGGRVDDLSRLAIETLNRSARSCGRLPVRHDAINSAERSGPLLGLPRAALQ